MKLSRLIHNLNPLKVVGSTEIDIRSVSCRSYETEPGDLFVAIKGTKVDGHEFIPQALSRGAKAIVLEEEKRPAEKECTWIRVKDSRIALAQVASNFFGHPGSRSTLVGITGTNGKTTTSFLVESILRAAGFQTGLIGTIEVRYGNTHSISNITTPESIDLQRILSEMARAGTTHTVLEVSSHALDLHRVWGLRFSSAVFTNLSRDHLDYHGTMERYFACKKRLFTHEATGRPPGFAVVNVDDPASEELISITPSPVITFGIHRRAQVRAGEVRYSADGISALLHTPRGDFPIRSVLLGEVNLYNLLAATAVGLSLGISLPSIQKGLEAQRGIPGRLEKVPNRRGLLILVDYAHTADALERLLRTAKGLTSQRLIVLFGCGGDRDRGKRPLMGAVGGRYSDLLILTSDNPRSEPPLSILQEIEEGLAPLPIRKVGAHEIPKVTNGPAYTVIPDRREAIRSAIAAARPGDCVAIAGKGHEDYQIIGERRAHFSDIEEARLALEQ